MELDLPHSIGVFGNGLYIYIYTYSIYNIHTYVTPSDSNINNFFNFDSSVGSLKNAQSNALQIEVSKLH